MIKTFSRRATENDRDAIIQGRLQAGQSARARLRLQVSGTALALTVVPLMLAILLSAAHVRCRTDLEGHVLGALIWFSACTSLLLDCLAPLADDRKTTMLVLAIGTASVARHICVNSLRLGTCGKIPEIEARCADSLIADERDCVAFYVMFLLPEVAFVFLALVAFTWSACGANVSAVQVLMWRSAHVLYGVVSLVGLVATIATLAKGRQLDVNSWSPLSCTPFFLASQSQRLRDNFHSWLSRKFTSTIELHAAAGVAGLVGECTVQEALKQAKQRFRCVAGEELAFEALLSNAAARALNGVAQPARLGECHAFLSHSWHDQPEAKWAALQGWRSQFALQMGQDPRVWFDKYCIDQTDIDSDLRSLPVYLSGCKELVLLIGPTYLRRLWCLVELFTFVHMKGDIGRIVLIPVLREGREEEDRAEIQRGFEAFGADECLCSNPNDKDKILSIIRSAYGSVDKFNTSVREILSDKRFVQQLHCHGLDSSRSRLGPSESESAWSDEESRSSEDDAEGDVARPLGCGAHGGSPQPS